MEWRRLRCDRAGETVPEKGFYVRALDVAAAERVKWIGSGDNTEIFKEENKERKQRGGREGAGETNKRGNKRKKSVELGGTYGLSC